MKIIEVKISSLVHLLCFTGFSIQIYDLTRLYLEFKVRHEVTYDYADQVELPTIDIIIPMVMSINLTELFIRYPEQMARICTFDLSTRSKKVHIKVNITIDNFSSVCVDEAKKVAFETSLGMAAFIKVKDINELTIDPRDQIDFIQIGNANATTDQCKMTRYYNGWAIFLRISCTKQAALNTDSINIVSSYEGKIATLGHSFGSYFGIRFTSPSDMPECTKSAYLMIIQKTDKKLSSWVRYEKMVSRSLPYPYETNCRYYNKLKALSNCIAEQTVNLGFLGRPVVNEWDSQPAHFGFVGDPSKILIEEILSHCAELPLLECDKTTYIIDGDINAGKANHTSGSIFIEKPVTPIMYFNVYPELLLSEYLIFVGGIVGTWFGFAIFDNSISILLWIKSKVIERIRKNRESKGPIKIFTIRKTHNVSSPKSDSSRCPSSHSSIDTTKSIRTN